MTQETTTTQPSSVQEHYRARLKPFQASVQAILREESMLTLSLDNTPASAYKRLSLGEEMLNLCSLYLVMSGVSLAILRQKNETFLNEARKAAYKALSYFEDVLSPWVDAPYSDYEERLASISGVSVKRRYQLIKKTGLAINLLQNAYGDNSKWKWSFAEMEGRFAAIAKNSIDLKTARANLDPSSPSYDAAYMHLALAKKLLSQSADRYREMYELSSSSPEDLKTAIRFLGGLLRIHTALGERGDIELVKRKAAVWTGMLEAAQKPKRDPESPA